MTTIELDLDFSPLDREVRDWLENAPEEYKICRGNRHRRPLRMPKWVLEVELSGRELLVRKWECDQCGMGVKNRCTISNDRLPTQYFPPVSDQTGKSDYYLPKGHGRLPASDLRAYEIMTQVGGIKRKRQPTRRAARKGA